MCQQVDFVRRTGVQVGSRVYIDAEWAGEPGVTYGDGSSADRGSIVYGHMLAFNGQENELLFKDVDIGKHAHIGARAAVLPGVKVGQRDALRPGELRMDLGSSS